MPIADNHLMHRLRTAHFLARLVLVWFALSIGAAIASPFINPLDTQLICSGNGAMKVLVKDADGKMVEGSGHKLNCPLCATLGAPPPEPVRMDPPSQPLAYVLQTIPAARIAALVGAPLPARGPPHHS